MSRGSLPVSVIILAKNEALRIKKCLDSLRWADETLVIDNGSTDETAKIAEKHGASVISADSRNFSDLRDLGRRKTRGDWLLYVDADEVVSPELAAEIKEIVRGLPMVYALRRRNYYLGHPWPYVESIPRLFHRELLVGWKGELHETAMVKGQTGILKGFLLHDTHRQLSEMVEKTNEWSEIEARHRLEANHPPVVPWRLFRVMLTAFWDSFIKQGGWRAGTVGWIESIYQAFSMFITYAKLWEMQYKNRLRY